MKIFIIITIVSIFFIPIIVAQATENKQNQDTENIETGISRLKKDYISLGLGAEFIFPILDASRVMSNDLALGLNFLPRYNITYNWGCMGIGIIFGVEHKDTKDVPYDYLMRIYPIGITGRYETNFNFPLFAFFELNFGMTVTSIEYRDCVPDYMEDGIYPMSFLIPILGCGYYIIPNFSISLYANFLLVPMQITSFTSIAPGIRL